jgi:hypothetical protein
MRVSVATGHLRDFPYLAVGPDFPVPWPTEPTFALARDPRPPLGPIPPVGETPGPGLGPAPRRTSKLALGLASGRRWRPWGWPDVDPAIGGGNGNSRAGRDRVHSHNLLLTAIFLAPAVQCLIFGNETVALVVTRLSAATNRKTETMPSTENGTVRIARRRPAIRATVL